MCGAVCAAVPNRDQRTPKAARYPAVVDVRLVAGATVRIGQTGDRAPGLGQHLSAGIESEPEARDTQQNQV